MNLTEIEQYISENQENHKRGEERCNYIIAHPDQYQDLLPYFFQIVTGIYESNEALATKWMILLIYLPSSAINKRESRFN